MPEVTNTVRFVLDGRIVEARGVRRTTTVLDYLREHLHRTGTKEGCAEGDCGACVVLVGELTEDGQRVRYAPVNSCLQLLPTLDGKSLKTVESLQGADGRLHPVQEAMVACHGSQCGFCTPGIVMSLAGLLQSVAQPGRAEVNDALSGNLCRCTGYRPIVDAALQAAQAPAEALRIDDAADLPLLQQIRRATEPTYSLEGEIVVQPVLRTKKGSEFVAPATVEELADYLVKNPDATLLAGSTEIGLKINKAFLRPARIAYLGHVAQLRRVQTTPEAWQIGAAVPLAEVQALLADAYPDFAEVLRRFGSPPIRSTATLAGNIANGSPIGDSMPCLMALDATLLLRRGRQTRRLPLTQFYTGQKRTVLESGEFIEAVVVPRPRAGEVFRAHKVSKRFEQDISATLFALRYRLVEGRFADVRVACNGLAPAPGRVPLIEAVLEGRAPADVTAAELDAAVAAGFTPRDGLRASWRYRALLARNLVLQFVEDAAGVEETAR